MDNVRLKVGDAKEEISASHGDIDYSVGQTSGRQSFIRLKRDSAGTYVRDTNC